jgi:hypothetical protein
MIVHQHGHIEDVNDDGYPDPVMHFDTQDAGIACGDVSADLTAVTYAGIFVAGSDAVRTVSCK